MFRWCNRIDSYQGTCNKFRQIWWQILWWFHSKLHQYYNRHFINFSMGCGILIFQDRNMMEQSQQKFVSEIQCIQCPWLPLKWLSWTFRKAWNGENGSFITNKRDATFGMFTGAGNKGISFQFTLIIEISAVDRCAVVLVSLSMNCSSIKESKSMRKEKLERSFHLTCYLDIELSKLIIFPF